MAIYFNGITIVSDSVVEPVSLTDAKNWLRITNYTTDDVMIKDLINSARLHIEKLTGISLVNRKYRVEMECSGISQSSWIVDLPYTPLLCVDEVKLKTGINSYQTLTKNVDYEVIGGKLWLYAPGNYRVTYQSGYGVLPEDLVSDILTLVAWSYQNRGKQFQGAAKEGMLKEYPNWDGLNYHQYKKVVI